jgi:hypothetical protein
MTDTEATSMATSLLLSFGPKAFEISMPDEKSYSLMRETFARLGRVTGPDGEFFVVRVLCQEALGRKLTCFDVILVRDWVALCGSKVGILPSWTLRVWRGLGCGPGGSVASVQTLHLSKNSIVSGIYGPNLSKR